MTTRTDLPANPAQAHQQITELIAQHRETEQNLLAVRGQILREIASKERGGPTRLARVLGVTDVQAGRLLAEDLQRAVHNVCAAVGLQRGEYRLRPLGQAHPARVELSLVDSTVYPSDGPTWQEDNLHDADAERSARRAEWVGRMNAAGALLDALHRAGLDAEADGLAVDVDGAGPRTALAAEQEVCVFWA